MQNVAVCLKEPTRVKVPKQDQLLGVCVSVQDAAVIVSLSWLVQRRGAEVAVAPKLLWGWCLWTPVRELLLNAW